LNSTTKELLDQVKVIRPSGGPTRIDGSIISTTQSSSKNAGVTNVVDWIQNVVATLRNQPAPDGFRLEREAGNQGILLHHRRQLADGHLLFLVNTSAEHPARGTLFSSLKGVESWDLYSGQVRPFSFASGAAGISSQFDLPPCGSLLLFLSQRPGHSAARQ